MSDARWFEIEADVAAAVLHFTRSVELFAADGFRDDSLDGYRAGMAFMHSMQSAHTSLETALVRILAILHEELPTGSDWHKDLIRRARHAMDDRPAILPPELAAAADETRTFRYVAMRGYGSFEPDRAVPAVSAARLLAAQFAAAVDVFRQAIAPPSSAQ